MPQVPHHPVDTGLLGSLERFYCLTLVIKDGDGDVIGRSGLQIVVDGSTVGRALSYGLVIENTPSTSGIPETVCRPRSEKMNVGIDNLRRELLEGGDVIHNPEASPIGAYHQIIEMLLNDHPVHRRVWHVVL